MTKPFEIEVVKDELDEMNVGRKGRQEEEVWGFGLSFGVNGSAMSQAGGAWGVNQWDIRALPWPGCSPGPCCPQIGDAIHALS